VVSRIQLECHEEVMELLSESNTADSQIFGTDIPYNPARVVWPDTVKLHNMSTEKTNTDKFTMMIHETKPSTQKKSVSICLIFEQKINFLVLFYHFLCFYSLIKQYLQTD